MTPCAPSPCGSIKDQSNPTLILETVVKNDDRLVDDTYQNAPTAIETTILTLEKNNQKILMLIGGLTCLIILTIRIMLYQHFTENDATKTISKQINTLEPAPSPPDSKIDLSITKQLTQSCLRWAKKIEQNQRQGGGFSEIPQMPPQPWDTGQQLTALNGPVAAIRMTRFGLLPKSKSKIGSRPNLIRDMSLTRFG